MSDPQDKPKAGPEDSQTFLDAPSPFGQPAAPKPAPASGGLTAFPLPKPPPGAGLFDEGETTSPGDGPIGAAAEETDLASSTVRTAPALIDEPLPASSFNPAPGGPAPFPSPRTPAAFVPDDDAPAWSTRQTDLPPAAPRSSGPGAGPASPAPAAAGPDAASTRLLDVPAEAEPAESRPGPLAGAYSRRPAEPSPAAAMPAAPEPVAEAPALPAGLNPAQKKALGVLAGFVAVFFLYLALGTTSFKDVPRRADLELAYPYGIDGARGSHGQLAPGALEVEYDYLESVPCTEYAKCVRYRYSQGEDFEGTMILGKRFNGDWQRTSDEGMPFRKREK